ncbi:hypothetical protein [Bacillus sp. FJAT-49736]|uniref:hypothetical protein n=1 Tax=Bacillus sp. FJAT-49736 TaxID=2833582 RepID=UPI001BC9F7F2|nr:hypothetical protein [Bacillus sp. FJAT-49736]MBS4174868.1 hypothetical protein [Bacillus sp. FJAT-49736]
MGLFINKNDHPEVFHNPGNIHESNQGLAKIDYLSEVIKGQKEAYESLQVSFHDLKHLHQQQESNQIHQWKDIGGQLKELQENHQQQKEFECHVMEWLIKLDNENRKLQGMIENEDQLKQKMIEQIHIVSQSNLELMTRLAQYESSNQALAQKINEQLERHQQMSEQFSRQEDIQNELLTRLDNQEALTEKILRQINHIRSILFERTNYLAEKIENGYKITSSYVYKLMTGSDKPLTLLMMNQKEEEHR